MFIRQEATHARTQKVTARLEHNISTWTLCFAIIMIISLCAKCVGCVIRLFCDDDDAYANGIVTCILINGNWEETNDAQGSCVWPVNGTYQALVRRSFACKCSYLYILFGRVWCKYDQTIEALQVEKFVVLIVLYTFKCKLNMSNKILFSTATCWATINDFNMRINEYEIMNVQCQTRLQRY